MKVYSEAEMNAAIARVETAKQNHPLGWEFIEEFGLKPADSYVGYIFMNGVAHVERLGREEDRVVIYSAGWLNGVSIGVSLGQGGT